MVYKVLYKGSVEQDLRKLDKPAMERIVNKIESDLAKDPDRGESLVGRFKGLFSYRIGDYRVIYTKIRKGILVLRVAHRREAYKRPL